MLNSTNSLRYGFDYDRNLLMDVAVGAAAILPIINTFVLHPAVLYLVSKGRTMSIDIRLGYVSTVIGMIFSDWCIFCIRPYVLAPYSGLYFDGPLARDGRIGMIGLRALFSFIITLCFPCFLFLTVRMHHMVLRGSESRWLFSTRSQCVLFFVLFTIVQTNVLVFAGFAVNSENMPIIGARSEIAWIVNRGGTLLIFGDFGLPEQMKYELALLALSIAIHAPIVIAFSMHSINRLKKCRKCAISSRTLHMTNQMVEVFDRQLKGANIHLLVPLVTFIIISIVDTSTFFPGCVHSALRFIITILFITNPFQFSLVFILKTRGHAKLLSSLKSEQSLSSLEYQSIINSKDSPKTDPTWAIATPLM